MRPIRSPLAARLDDDFLPRLRDEDLLISPQLEAALEDRRNPQDRPAPTPRELAPQLEQLAPQTESACGPEHPPAIFLRDELPPAQPAQQPLRQVCVALGPGS